MYLLQGYDIKGIIVFLSYVVLWIRLSSHPIHASRVPLFSDLQVGCVIHWKQISLVTRFESIVVC